jgi:hypothetical protein
LRPVALCYVRALRAAFCILCAGVLCPDGGFWDAVWRRRVSVGGCSVFPGLNFPEADSSVYLSNNGKLVACFDFARVCELPK